MFLDFHKIVLLKVVHPLKIYRRTKFHCLFEWCKFCIHRSTPTIFNGWIYGIKENDVELIQKHNLPTGFHKNLLIGYKVVYGEENKTRDRMVIKYSPQTMSWSPQGMRVLRQCTVPRAELMFVTNKRENIRRSKKILTKLSQFFQTVRCLQLGYESLRLLIADQEKVFRPPACFVLPPHCIKDVYNPQGSTRDLWTISVTLLSKESRLKCIAYLFDPTWMQTCIFPHTYEDWTLHVR
jgi:hypothetical protein